MSDRLSHLDKAGRARMVDVGDKPVTHRVCVARGEVRMAASTLARITTGNAPKGDVIAVARLAGIQAAKRAAEWIPLAHPLPLDSVRVHLTPESGDASGEARLLIEAVVATHWRTGVEMEALVAVGAAGLTVYDMCKSIDRGMSLEAIRLVRKSGGKSGDWERPGEPPPVWDG